MEYVTLVIISNIVTVVHGVNLCPGYTIRTLPCGFQRDYFPLRCRRNTSIQGFTSFSLLVLNNTGLYHISSTSLSEATPMLASDIEVDSEFSLMVTDSSRVMVYAYDRKRKLIVRFNIYKRRVESFYRVTGQLSGMAVDWSSGNVYISDIEQGTLSVITNNGLFSRVLHQRALSRPGALAILQRKKKLIWVEHQYDTIKYSSLDESDGRDLVRDVCHVTALEVDEEEEVLYFFSSRTLQLQKVKLDHSTSYSKCLVTCTRSEVKQMALASTGHLFYLEEGDTKTQLVMYDTHENDPKEIRHHYKIQAIGAVLPLRHNSTFGCSVNNGGCQQICFDMDDNKTKCSCDTTYRTHPMYPAFCKRDSYDNAHHGLLIVADQLLAKLFHIHYGDKFENISHIPVLGLKQPYAVTFDGSKVYWSDLETCTISRSFLNGSHQEVIYTEDNTYITDIEVDIFTSSLYFADYGHGRIGVINTENLKFLKYIIQDQTYRPFGLAISSITKKENAYPYNGHPLLHITSSGVKPRLRIYELDGTNYNFSAEMVWNPRGIAATQVDVYWIDGRSVKSQKGNDPVKILYTSEQSNSMHDVSVDQNILTSGSVFVSDAHTQSVLRLRTTDNHNPRQIGKGALARPTGIHVISYSRKKTSLCSTCKGVCVWLQGKGNTCLTNTTRNRISKRNLGLCKVPKIHHGHVIDNRVSAKVVEGTTIHAECLPGHHVKSLHPMTCKGGDWLNRATCVRDYKLHGNYTRGWVKFNKPGEHVFYKYDEMPTILSVIIVGGGGGGYDGNDAGMRNLSQAGDGTESLFENSKYNAEGGKGGNATTGGAGGFGRKASGGNGTWNDSCSRGGDAGAAYCSFIRKSLDVQSYCGVGGASDGCQRTISNVTLYTHPFILNPTYNHSVGNFKRPKCGKESIGANGGNYGGGAAGNGGGGGGGGGYTCTYNRVLKDDNRAIRVVVGDGGKPSYGKAGVGLVVVMWGMGDPCEQEQVVKTCSRHRRKRKH